VDDGLNGAQLWKSDGTAAGTVLVESIHRDQISPPGSLTNVNGTLFFVADDGVNGRELWKSDGTAAGTMLVDIALGPGGSAPTGLTDVNGTLFFTAFDGFHGFELWVTIGQLAVEIVGQGRVQSSPVGLDCGTAGLCPLATFLSGATVTLLPTPAPGFAFGGWSGDCSGFAACVLSMQEDRAVIASFVPSPRPNLVVALVGAGGVTSAPAGIACNPTCSATFNLNTVVTLTAAPAPGFALTGWSGCDVVNGLVCTVTLGTNRAVTATFAIQQFTLTVLREGGGPGSVGSAPAGIACGAQCQASFASGTVVTLTATVAAGGAFAGWSGCDSAGGLVCTVTLGGNRAVTATFTVTIQSFTLTVLRQGSGPGSVGSAPAGIACGAQCQASFASGTVVTLTATVASGGAFGGWSGCDSVGGLICTVTLGANRAVTATFAVQQSELPVVVLTLNGATYRTGDTLLATATLTPGATPLLVDAYVVVQVPSGAFLSLTPQGLIPGLVPFAAGFVPVPFGGELLRYTFTGGEPPGPYTWMTALTHAGTLTVIGTIDQDPFVFLR
jgi:ELWxxDGT repeat protein